MLPTAPGSVPPHTGQRPTTAQPSPSGRNASPAPAPLSARPSPSLHARPLCLCSLTSTPSLPCPSRRNASGSTVPPMFYCRWDFCPHTFPTTAALAEHVREHVAREQPVYVPPSARHLGPDGVWTVDDSWTLSMSVDSTGPSTSAPAASGSAVADVGDLSSSGVSGLSSDVASGLAPALGPGIGGALGSGLGQANLGAALTGSGYGLGAAFFAPISSLGGFDDMPPPPPPEANDTMFADFLRSPSPRRAAQHQALAPAQMQSLSQASLHFSQQMQSTPADAAASQSSAAAVSPPTEGPPQTQWG